MKQKDWSQVPWTPFQPCVLPTDPVNQLDPATAIFRNSRYQVTVYVRDDHPVFGRVAHLSFKTHDRAPYHDWRDIQRIKNEICGPECDAVEIYPAESKLVDTSNQYHLFVFQSYRLDIGFQERLVGDGTWDKSQQRPFPPGERPADCLGPEAYDAMVKARLAAAQNGKVCPLCQQEKPVHQPICWDCSQSDDRIEEAMQKGLLGVRSKRQQG